MSFWKMVPVWFYGQETVFNVSGTRIIFAGYLKAYENNKNISDINLPACKVGEKLTLNNLKEEEHKTRPSARYNEASLVQTLEKEGIGRSKLVDRTNSV